ncbi:N-6 DNA methylase, partial [Paraliomyxa miuraensis]|uniref:N-6 DNA methylase n=1 Tax=Paraliomyxa miuraensis TaxID=376150 RepID=UPI0022567AFA
MAKDPETRAHQEWLGLLQPVGLVVSPPALVKAQAVVARNAVELQRRLLGVMEKDPQGRPRLPAWEVLARGVLDWEAEDLVSGEAMPTRLEVALPDHQEVLRPTHAVPDGERDGEWLMVVQELREVDDLQQLDRPPAREQRGWHASPQIKLERLLRDTGVALGMICTPVGVRMVVAPAGESSGHLTFPAGAMAEVGGRPIVAALHMLLCAERMFTLPPGRRLPAIVAESRKYQNVVSTQLAEQVLRALGELLRGFQAADEATEGQLLGEVVREDPQHVYGGLITVLMRLVFLLYAEEREMLPDDPVYVGHYSVGGLFERLRADAGLYPDTMDQRYGAWAQLLSLFRLVFDGGGHGGMWLPAREGQLFHPDEYPFLEGRAKGSARQRFGAEDDGVEPPKVSDGVVVRVLEDLLMLDGERLSYRSLDVEQIGSVYEAVMGFEVKRTRGASIGVRPQHVVVDLEEVLRGKGKARVEAFEKGAGCKLGGKQQAEVKAAGSVDELVAAIEKKVSPQTPRVLPVGSLYLQPTEERRRSGSHYTPRSLTEPIVRTTLRPVLEGLEAGGERATAERILGLKVCDPAMGSGAFLVEACRHLAQMVVEAWERDGKAPELGADEDLLLHARRLVAQRCLYGVDKNPFAVS